jgi:pectin methylesterase-like acyl-CoA thioesterase
VTYSGTLTITAPGTYNFFTAYQRFDGTWNTSIPTDPGIINAWTITVGGGVAAEPPGILFHPSSASVMAGGYTSMFVVATGDRLSYQWSKNATPIPGATDLQLKFTAAQPDEAGDYSVVVGNSGGSTPSKTANLLVVSSMKAVSFGPANWAAGTCNDTTLFVTFDQPPTFGKSGRIQVFNSKGAVVDTIDMAANPQTRLIGGTPYSYSPVIVNGNTATILLHQLLPYDHYSVTMEPGALADSDGVPFRGIGADAVWRFETRAAPPAAGAAALTVAADGSADFCTVQGAVDFVPAGNSQPVTITVRPGAYTEIVNVPANKPFVIIRGADRVNSVVQYPNNTALNPSTASRPLMNVEASDFTLENITLWNTTPKGVSQAESFRGNNSRILLNRVTLKSLQNTLLLQGGGAFVTDSYIEGDVDFMWGTGPAWFQNSELKAVTAGGYYTQIRNDQGQNGFFYVNSRLTASAGVNNMYLARIDPGVFPYSQVVYINCAMGPYVLPAGWLLDNATTAPNAQFWEYKSTDASGAALDVSQRAPFSRQLTAQEAAQWSDPANVLGGWVPYTVNGPAAPVAAGSAFTANWSAAPNHSAKDWIGLFAAGAPDFTPLAQQFTGAATTGQLKFTAPAAGQYEFRLFLDDGSKRAALGNTFSVQ